ncbi:putative H+/anion permease [Magnetospirillum gryphiswaldense MSR-1 v2]|uniref:H+/anion permease n=1 Tax=Magnetospirillum gryphiswaldense (strain DSM 6361 / JCM 21280 / NBRC 15271 / MSR-1) TaxID=431944 RepID=V6F8H8_MAGGM|nr:putative H+/anion permease [Magnetospirillum gryphiswaldense]CDL00988.1 putative H+/anion permease [Magnetospirillum gryphiswaldense MSR-1 v2]
MPELNALYLVIVLMLIGLAVGRLGLMPFVALLLGAALFGQLAGSSFPWAAKEFNMGFGQTLAAAGLAVVAGAMLSVAWNRAGAALWWRPRLDGRFGPLLGMIGGLLAGLGGTPLAGLAAVTPIAWAAGKARGRVGLALASGISAAHGCLVPAPLPIAALAILGGDWRWGLGFGLAAALVQALVGLWLAGRADDCGDADNTSAPPNRRAGWAGLAGVIIMVGLVIGHALGQIPAEPFGGGNTRENILGLGRPMLLLLFGLGGALVVMGALGRQALGSDGWLAEGARRSVGVLLAVGAVGGWQMSLYNTGMAPLLAERLAGLPTVLGPALPFLMALMARALQGSALTATLTAAGIVQPLLVPLGLTGGDGAALAAVAVGAGAMAAPHLNDGFFWLAADHARLGVAGALKRISLGILAQSLAGLVVLMALWGLVH